MSGKLYLVATPIGNLEDITIRAINTLKEVDIIAAEDTRHTLKLLNHLEIKKPLYSYYRHNEQEKTINLLEKIEEGKNIALVSDAGTPAISDPGKEIVKKAIQKNIEIVPIPGPCALITALITSGLDTKEFIFIGFLPLNKKNRKEKLRKIENSEYTTILYEAPHKLLGTLKELKNVVGDRNIVIAKELTKIHETFIRGTIDEILNMNINPKGEYVILIQANLKRDGDIQTQKTVEELYTYYEEKGLQKREIIKQIAKDKKVPKNEIYKKIMY